MEKATGQTAFFEADLSVGPATAPGRYPVSFQSPAGEDSGVMQLEPTAADWQAELAAIEKAKTDEAFFTQFGERLFDALFPGDVLSSYRQTAGAAEAANKTVRLRLKLRPPEIAALPWEYLYDRPHDRFLGISDRTILSRYVPDAPLFERPMSVQPPLRVLVVLSSPADAASLNLARERKVLEKATAAAVDDGRLQLHWVQHAIGENIRQAMRDFEPHVFHFVGHGQFDVEKGRGYLLFEDDFAESVKVSDRVLREYFAGHEQTKLVVLNACEGAKADSGRAMSGLAPLLVARGLPAVVAMQYPLRDRTAVKFARNFYAELCREHPADVDVAVAAGRRAIYIDYGVDRPDWGIPVCFMRSPSGAIFAPEAEQERRTPTVVEGVMGDFQIGDVGSCISESENIQINIGHQQSKKDQGRK